jgi:dimethylargininase
VLPIEYQQAQCYSSSAVSVVVTHAAGVDMEAVGRARTDARVVFGGQSMTATLRTVMVRRPAPTVGGDEWQSFGYTRPVRQAETEREHRAFVDLLTANGVDVVGAGPDPTGHLDAIFAYDPSLVTNRGAILLRPGKILRLDEPALHRATYSELGIPIVGAVEPPGTVEGGDTLWLDEQTLAVGRGYRTNDDGIRQLGELLRPLGIDVVIYDLPHYHGPGECLHLMSLISPVADKVAVVYLRLMPVALVERLKETGWTLLEIPDAEFGTMGCNVLSLGEGKCVIANRNPGTKAVLERAGLTVLEYEGDHISHNRQGGPTCLTRPILRES